MLDTVQELNLIVANPNVCGGRPYIIGTTVTVSDVIIAKLYHGQDSDGIASWRNLTLPQVYAELTRYYAFKDDIDQQIRRQIKRATALKEQQFDYLAAEVVAHNDDFTVKEIRKDIAKAIAEARA